MGFLKFLGNSFLNGLTGAVASVPDFGLGMLSQGISNAQSKSLMRYQNNLNIQNWRMVNEYNSPKAQMARYQEAGLNPNLVYGSLGDSAAASLTSPSLQSADFDRRSNPIQAAFLNQQLEQSKAQTALMKAQAFKAWSESFLDTERYEDQKWRNTAEFRSQALKLLTNQAKYMGYHADTEFSNSIFADELNEASVSLKRSARILNVDEHQLNSLRADLLRTNNNLAQSQVALNGALMLTEKARQFNLIAGGTASYESIKLMAANIDKIVYECKNIVKQGGYIDQQIIERKIKNEYLRTYGKEQMSDQISGTAATIAGAISKLCGYDLNGFKR